MALGLDQEVLRQADRTLSIKRIQKDIQTDFIYAPYLSVVYHWADADLWNLLTTKLKNGRFAPRLPVTLEIPKSSGFTRPGSVLWPLERLAYQLIADSIAPTAEAALERSIVFSNVLLDPDPDGFMFAPGGDSYRSFKEALSRLCGVSCHTHAIRADVACFFERLYQHVLINSLRSAGCSSAAVSFLEGMLSLFMQKDSHGIIQGVFPSDFLGSFYLLGLDALHQIHEIPSIRYVDDLYCFFPSRSVAQKHLVTLSKSLRAEGLNLNESKTRILPVSELIHEETELDEMFAAARDETRDSLRREDFYSSTMLVDLVNEDNPQHEQSDLDLVATYRLFDSKGHEPHTRQKIDSFCLSVFAAARDPHAIDYVVDRYIDVPHMAQRFSTYLGLFIGDEPELAARVSRLLKSEVVFDYQRLWLYALLARARTLGTASTSTAARHLKDAGVHEAARAAAAVLVAKFGSSGQRRVLKEQYQNDSSALVHAALVYSARFFPKGERNNCYAAWGGHDEVNALIVAANKNANERGRF